MILVLLNKLRKGWKEEHRFHSTRKWRFDFAHEELKIAIEIEGAVWVRGRHTRGKGYLADMEKYNTAQSMGWRVFRYAPNQTALLLADMERLVKTPTSPATGF